MRNNIVNICRLEQLCHNIRALYGPGPHVKQILGVACRDLTRFLAGHGIKIPSRDSFGLRQWDLNSIRLVGGLKIMSRQPIVCVGVYCSAMTSFWRASN